MNEIFIDRNVCLKFNVNTKLSSGIYILGGNKKRSFFFIFKGNIGLGNVA